MQEVFDESETVVSDWGDYLFASADAIGRGLALSLPFLLLIGMIFKVMNSILEVAIK